MPRIPRHLIIADDSKFHITWRSHNRSWFLEEEWQKQLYFDLVYKFKDRFGVEIYSFCLMSSHPHLTGHCRSQKELSDFMRNVNTRFAQAINRNKKRIGQVICDRFKSPQIEDEEHLFRVMTYIDLNPVRANMVAAPEEYKWTSYRYYAFGEPNKLITPAPEYLALGSTPKERQTKYRQIVEGYLKGEGLLKRNYSCVYAIGNPAWVLGHGVPIKQYLQSCRDRHRLSQEKTGFL